MSLSLSLYIYIYIYIYRRGTKKPGFWVQKIQVADGMGASDPNPRHLVNWCL